MIHMISCIITTFNRDEKTLTRSLNSVLNQTYKNIEIIVVDDNGLKNEYSQYVANAVSNLITLNNFKLLRHKDNMGAQVARNNGIKNASGDFIAFLDDDDEWLPNKLELQMKRFKNSNVDNLGLVYCGRYNIRSISEFNTKEVIENIEPPYGDVIKKLIRKNFIGSTSFPLIKKEVFDEVGYFDESLIAKQDYDMWIRIAKKYGIDYVREPLCKYYSHSGERITTNPSKKLIAEKKFLEKHFDLISRDKIALSGKYRHIAKYYFALYKYKKSRENFIESLKLNPTKIKNYIWILLTYIKYRPPNIKYRYDEK